MPHVSVIIPTYNRGAELLPTVESALTQSYSDFEVIIVDDASTDDTYEVAQTIRDARVRVYRLPVNRGVAGAFNEGIRLACGSLIAILEHDDFWLPTKLEKQVALFKDERIGLVYCDVGLVDEQRNVRESVPGRHAGDIYVPMLLKSPIFTCSIVVIRRECFEKCGMFDEQLRFFHENDMFNRIARYYRIAFVPEVLAHYPAYHVSSRVLGKPEVMVPMAKRLLQKYATYDYPSAWIKRRVIGYRHYLTGNLVMPYGGTGEARSYYLKSLYLWPFAVKCWMSLGASLFGKRVYSGFAGIKRSLFGLLYNRVR